jgi:enoyl-CoA hydratase/carnithine racemase
MALEYERLEFEIRDSVCRITLSDPDSGNSLGETMRGELLQALLGAQDDDSVHLVLINGADREFCSGVPLQEISGLREGGAGFERLRPLLDEGRRLISLLHEFPKPVVAGLNGPARAEGAALALACDLRVASVESTLALDFSRSGMAPAWGTSSTLARLAGPGTALELLWTGRVIHAEEAARHGLVQILATADRFEAEVDALCSSLGAIDASVLHLTRMAVQSSHVVDLASALDLETEIQHRCWTASNRRDIARN